MSMILTSVVSLSVQAQTVNDGSSLLNKSVEVTGFGQIRYREPLVTSKSGFPILLVHGVYGGASHRAWRELLPLLDQAGEAVYIVDLPGVGESDRPKRAYAIQDLDLFLERFLDEVVKSRTTVVTESITSANGLRVASLRPDLVRRLIMISPTGVNSLNVPPSTREQKLYDRLYNDEAGSIGFYQNLLNDNSLQFFLKFAFFDDSKVNEGLLNDYRVARPNLEQRWLTLSFVGGQLWRHFKESSEKVFVPTLAIFGAEYEPFADNQPSKASDFQAIRPEFEYLEIPGSGSSAQREKPEAVAKAITEFATVD
ncbi:MAG: alpha/beta fold hydrolase [Pseudobdellovibrionaceae bacterium]